MNNTSIVRRCSYFSAIAILLSSGCFQGVNVSDITCTDNSNCPSGYLCARPNTKGGCEKGGVPMDGGKADSPASFDSPTDKADVSSKDNIQPSDSYIYFDSNENRDTLTDGPTISTDGPLVSLDVTEKPDQAFSDTIQKSDQSVPDTLKADIFIKLDAPTEPDVPITTPDASGSCSVALDCPGPCQTCSPNNTCVALTSKDDPTGRCAGSCDANGACKAKQGQTCQASSACISGTYCSPDGYCCNKACTGSCESCESGICSPVTGNPHTGHTACTGTSTECSGSCTGATNGQCTWPTTTCSTASCTGIIFQPAGTCNFGICNIPTNQSCPSREVCSGNTCACLSPNRACTSGCTNVQDDPHNCGSCGHDCLGSTCVSGKCNPAIVIQSAGLYSFVFGVDSQYIYYSDCSDYYTCTVLRVNKSATGSTGAPLTSEICLGLGVIGNTLLLFKNQQPSFVCEIGSACNPSDVTRRFPSSGAFVPFKSPPPMYFGMANADSALGSIAWYSTSLAQQSFISWNYQASSVGNFISNNTAAFWTQNNTDGSGNPISISLYGSVGFSSTIPAQLAGSLTQTSKIVDANSKSILIHDTSSNHLYRVPLPEGLGIQSPQQIITSTATTVATEDASGIYWMSTTGSMYKCIAPNCSSSTLIAANQGMGNHLFGLDMAFSNNGLYQDDVAIYWINSQGQLVRLAK
jgi:hypothetical protein